ncbi:MAG: hypothetical protein V4519_02805 [Patescibacteria group bacterium]
MSKSELKHQLKVEIKRLNKLIDQKILEGKNYTAEARHHKILLSRLSIMKKSSFLARSMRVMATMMF